MSYNGWKNWETWNIAFWLGNDELLYNLALRANSYSELIETLKCYSQGPHTPDGSYWGSKKVDRKAITSMIKEMQQ